MRLDDLDQKAQRLREASERISANLVELEIDSGRQLLEASALEGQSAAQWGAASAALNELWRRHGLLEGLLEQADQLRRARRADQLGSLLNGPSIELSSSDVPLADRDLLGSPRAAERCSADQLLASMSAAFDEVKTVVSRIGAAWDVLIPKLDGARRLLQETNRLAEELGEPGRRDVESATQTLAALSASVTGDPLAVQAGDIDGLTRALRTIRDDLGGSVDLRRGFETRILLARELLDRLQAAIRDGQAAHEELLAKISVPAAPPPAEAREDLDGELTQVAALAHQGAWREARRALEAWTARTDALLEAAERALVANRAPIQARNQFRALLEAYQVKAKRLGVLEDPRLADIFAQAHEVLYSAPTNLALAAQLVRSYQQALSGSRAAPEAML